MKQAAKAIGLKGSTICWPADRLSPDVRPAGAVGSGLTAEGIGADREGLPRRHMRYTRSNSQNRNLREILRRSMKA